MNLRMEENAYVERDSRWDRFSCQYAEVIDVFMTIVLLN